jgi:HipA-like protein
MKGGVYINGELAGMLEKKASGEYEFRYEDAYFLNPSKPSISLTNSLFFRDCLQKESIRTYNADC